MGCKSTTTDLFISPATVFFQHITMYSRYCVGVCWKKQVHWRSIANSLWLWCAKIWVHCGELVYWGAIQNVYMREFRWNCESDLICFMFSVKLCIACQPALYKYSRKIKLKINLTAYAGKCSIIAIIKHLSHDNTCLPSISLLFDAYNSTHASTEMRRADLRQISEQSCTYLAKN